MYNESAGCTGLVAGAERADGMSAIQIRRVDGDILVAVRQQSTSGNRARYCNNPTLTASISLLSLCKLA